MEAINQLVIFRCHVMLAGCRSRCRCYRSPTPCPPLETNRWQGVVYIGSAPEMLLRSLATGSAKVYEQLPSSLKTGVCPKDSRVLRLKGGVRE